jgi:hypothetical protein
LEEKEDCWYVKKTGNKETGEGGEKTEYFTCNRGGVYTPKGTGKRSLKSQG